MNAQQLNALLRPFHESAGDQLKAQAELDAAVTSWLAGPNEAPAEEEPETEDSDEGNGEHGMTHRRGRGYGDE